MEEALKDNKFKNVFGDPLQSCSCRPLTGWYRDGSCKTDPSDYGQHTICCVMTEAFLRYSKGQGNDLSTPMPQYGFEGLKEGDQWCICARRWKQAYDDGMAPIVILESTEISTLEVVGLSVLKNYARIADK